MTWNIAVVLWLLLALPLVVAAVWYSTKKMREKRQKFFSDELFANLYTGERPIAKKIKMGFLYAAIFFAIIGAAGPKIGTEVREVKRQGVNVMIALDLSASMNAEDVRPSRLEKAKYEINRLVKRLDGDRVGLIVFTGEAYMQSPLTLDYSALRLFLSTSSTDQMPSSGTNFAEAINKAADAFENEDEKESKAGDASRVLLIISDGEDHSEGYEDALKNVTSLNVSVYTLGIGTEQGTTIPVKNKRTGNLMGYKRDKDGKVVTTKLQTRVLKDIAQQGNGSYYEIQSGIDGIDSFLARLDELEKGEFSNQEYADYKDQYQWLLAIAVVCMGVFVSMPTAKKIDIKHSQKKTI